MARMNADKKEENRKRNYSKEPANREKTNVTDGVIWSVFSLRVIAPSRLSFFPGFARCVIGSPPVATTSRRKSGREDALRVEHPQFGDAVAHDLEPLPQALFPLLEDPVVGHLPIELTQFAASGYQQLVEAFEVSVVGIEFILEVGGEGVAEG
jgi:hypothetical protein